MSQKSDLEDQLAELRRVRRRAEEREAAIRDLIQTIARSAFDLDAVLQTVIEHAVSLTEADHGEIARRDGDVYRVVALKSFSPEYERLVGEQSYVPDQGSIIGRALLERKVVQIPDVLADPDYALLDLQKAGGYRTVLGVPLLRDREAIGVIGVGRSEARPFTEAEIRLLETFADHVTVAIENIRLFQTVERQRAELARFAPQAADLLSSEGGEELLAGHRREITAVFWDLRGFTAFAETAEPEEVMGVLREYHTAVGRIAVDNGGTIEHFAGDGLLAFFNDPTPIEDHEVAAVRTALETAERFAGLASGWRKRGHELGLGIGIATGYATLGRVGFEGRYEYGAVGNVVILASRLSDAAQAGEILVAQRAHAAVEEHVVAEPSEPLELKGFSRPVSAFRVVAARD